MRKVERNDACPCESGLKFKKCCGPALAGDKWPETPEALMRSRYTAYVAGHAEWLWKTTHPENEARKGTDWPRFERETVEYCRSVEFTGLRIHETWEPDDDGIGRVLFTAEFQVGPSGDALTELSEFVKVDGNWVYRKGDIHATEKG